MNTSENMNEYVHDDAFMREKLYYEKTRNPIYVWEAIRRARDLALWDWDDAQRSLSEEEYEKAVAQKMHAGTWPPAPKELPEWCMRYLLDTASRIYFLQNALDERKRPEDNPDQTEEENHLMWRAWKQGAPISAKNATNRLPAAFGFARKGWNAIDEIFRGNIEDDIREKYASLLAGGLTKSLAQERLLTITGITDERQLRRILTYKTKLGKMIEAVCRTWCKILQERRRN